MKWTALRNKKFYGKTLPQVILIDPDWFFWAYENNLWGGNSSLSKEAEEIYRRATSIRIPQITEETLIAEYWIHPSTNKFSEVKVILNTKPPHIGSSNTIRKEVFDLSVPRQIAKYDKLGNRLIILSLKHYIFKDKNIRLTKEICEEFFNNDSIFVL